MLNIKEINLSYQRGEQRGEGQVRNIGLTDTNYYMLNR